MSKIDMSFIGEVFQAPCKCHAGKFFILIFIVHPQLGRIPKARSDMFNSFDEAKDSMEEFTKSFAAHAVKEAGLDWNDAKEVRVEWGNAALQAEEKFKKENNPSLH